MVCPGAPEGSTESGSDFKASQKTGPRLKVSSDRLGEAEIEPTTPGLQGIDGCYVYPGSTNRIQL